MLENILFYLRFAQVDTLSVLTLFFNVLKKIFFFSIRDNIHIGFRDNCGCPQVVVAPSIQSAAAFEDSSRSPLHYHGTSKLYVPTSEIRSKAEFSESICN